jgi:hypothetical protein
MILKEKAKQELIKEDEIYKHLSKEDIDKILNEAD